jgi:hypothetical protein
MWLSLAFTLFVATAVGAYAAPQTTPKRAEPDQFVQMVTVLGTCTKLVHAGQPVDGCKSTLVNMNYSNGVSAYWFVTDQTILSFAGDGSRRIEQGPNIVVQAIDRLILATIDATKEDAAKGDTAVGFCRFGNPARKGMTTECVAHTQLGLYEAAFVTDGTPPKLEAFHIAP